MLSLHYFLFLTFSFTSDNNYYGHPNRKRGATDPRQCLWHSAAEASDTDYTAPLAILPASVDGIIEFESGKKTENERELVSCEYVSISRSLGRTASRKLDHFEVQR